MDLVTLKPLARVRVGIDSRAIAVSDDGLHVIVGNYWKFVYVSDWGGHKVYVLEENPATPYAAGKNSITPYKAFTNIPNPTGIFNSHRRYSPLGH